MIDTRKITSETLAWASLNVRLRAPMNSITAGSSAISGNSTTRNHASSRAPNRNGIPDGGQRREAQRQVVAGQRDDDDERH